MILRVRDDAGNVFDIPAIRGLSSYEIAVKHGFEGTEEEWLESIGVLEGKSAFEVAVDEGFEGDVAAWLESLVGPQGPQGEKGDTGATGATGPAGAAGTNGSTPNITIGTVTTLAAGSQATATITGTPAAPKLNLGIPKGDKGDQGASGESAGGLPSISTSDNGKFLRVVNGAWVATTVTSAEGVSF